MKRVFLLTTAALIALAAPAVANASIQNLSISGSLDGHDYTGTLSLDVNGGEAASGTGTLSILGLKNAPLVLITASTPGNEGAPMTGFRGNDGTDYFGLDQAYPISSNGLLFDVGTTTAEWGLHPAVRHLVGRDGLRRRLHRQRRRDRVLEHPRQRDGLFDRRGA